MSASELCARRYSFRRQDPAKIGEWLIRRCAHFEWSFVAPCTWPPWGQLSHVLALLWLKLLTCTSTFASSFQILLCSQFLAILKKQKHNLQTNVRNWKSFCILPRLFIAIYLVFHRFFQTRFFRRTKLKSNSLCTIKFTHTREIV